MKHHIPLLLLALALPLTSCLDEEPKGQLDAPEALSTPRDIYVNAVASLYNYIGGANESESLMGTCRGVYDYNTLTTDEAIIPIRGGDWYDGGLWENLYRHQWTPDDASLYDTWKYLYKVVMLANNSLDIIYGRPGVLSPTQQEQYAAETRAVRALFYYHIMDMYGRVPLALSRTEQPDGGMPQVERSRMYRFIISELQEVLPLLPDGRSNREGEFYGRMTRPVAQFLLARLAINAEVYADDDWTDGTRPAGSDIFFDANGQRLNAWQTCEYYCDRIADAGYELEPDYAANFLVHNENSRENIFTIPADKNMYAAQFHYVFRSIHYSQGGVNGWGTENGTCATLSTMRAYRFGEADEDTRCQQNFFTGVVLADGDTLRLPGGEALEYKPMEVRLNLTNSPYVKTAGARMKKYEIDPTAYVDGRLQDNDIVMYRYADVLLMKAEAVTRRGGDGSAWLNAVRDRAAMPRVACTLDNILRERLLELMWEGSRRQDLVRYGLFSGSYDIRTALPGEETGYTTVFPIPRRCLDLNHALKQNPGY